MIIHLFPLRKHAFHICQDSIPFRKAQIFLAFNLTHLFLRVAQWKIKRIVYTVLQYLVYDKSVIVSFDEYSRSQRTAEVSSSFPFSVLKKCDQTL